MRISGAVAGTVLVALALPGCAAGTGDGERAPGNTGTAGPAAPSGPVASEDGSAGSAAPSGPAESEDGPDGGSDGGSAGAATPLGACPAAAMTGRVTAPDAGAGNRYAELIVTNTGPVPCDATGFVGLKLYDAEGRALPTDVRHEGPQLRNIVIVPPGGHAYARIHWGVVTGDGDATEGPCQPSPATVGVTMPQDTERFRVAWNLGPVCQSGRIDVQALRTGLPPAGSAAPAPRPGGTPRADGPVPTGGPVDAGGPAGGGPMRD